MLIFAKLEILKLFLLGLRNLNKYGMPFYASNLIQFHIEEVKKTFMYQKKLTTEGKERKKEKKRHSFVGTLTNSIPPPNVKSLLNPETGIAFGYIYNFLLSFFS